jgi:hypothetical protein
MSEPKFKPGDCVRVTQYTRGASSRKEYKKGNEYVVVWHEDHLVRLDDVEDKFHANRLELVFRPATRAETDALRKLAEACKRLDDAFNADTPYEEMKYQINDVVIVYREMIGE